MYLPPGFELCLSWNDIHESNDHEDQGFSLLQVSEAMCHKIDASLMETSINKLYQGICKQVQILNREKISSKHENWEKRSERLFAISPL